MNDWRILSVDSSSASFSACVKECISERKSRMFEEGLNTES